MKIGEALKKERRRLGLTQNEMIQEIITKGHYSKIERGLEGISADSLFDILFAHNIDVDDFIEDIRDEYLSKEDLHAIELKEKMMMAFNNSDNENAKEYLNKILALKGHKIFKYRSIIAVATFEEKLDELSDEFKSKIINEFTKRDTWMESVDSLRLLANCMHIFTIEQLDYCLCQLLNHYSKNNGYSEKMIERIAIICNNYLYSCYFLDLNGTNVNSCINFLNSLDNRSHFMFYRITCVFYQHLFKGENFEAKKVKDALISWRYGSRVASWKI